MIGEVRPVQQWGTLLGIRDGHAIASKKPGHSIQQQEAGLAPGSALAHAIRG